MHAFGIVWKANLINLAEQAENTGEIWQSYNCKIP